MKLELWLKKNDNGKSDCFDLTIGQEDILTGSIKNLHVIGPCGECSENEECRIQEFVEKNLPTDEPFGCNHFDDKESH